MVEIHPVFRDDRPPRLASTPASLLRPRKEAPRQEAAEPINPINPADLEGQSIPPREWIVPDWLPVGSVTLCYADGGLGKSLLAQQLMSACAVGGAWCGLDVLRCRAVGFFCEDDVAELHRRQLRINAATGTTFADLAEARWISGVGQDNLLMTFERDGSGVVTDRFEQLRFLTISFRARLVIVDTAADTFGGNENERSQVRQFVGRTLTRLAQDAGAAVLLLAHPSRSGMGISGDQDGGSTAWSNSARSRWAITRPPPDGGMPDLDARLLTRRKANYAAVGASIPLRWANGVLMPPAGSGADIPTHTTAAELAEETFLALMGRLNEVGVRVSHSKNAGNYAPKVMVKRSDRAGVSLRALECAMHDLLAAGRIRITSYGRLSDSHECLVLANQAAPASETGAGAEPA